MSLDLPAAVILLTSGAGVVLISRNKAKRTLRLARLLSAIVPDGF